MLLFWRQGYEGTSLADLTKAMGISKPTLYAAFGDKESLLREALQLYLGLRAEDYIAALNRLTIREVTEAWLRLTAGVREEAGVPSGCFVVQGALAGSQASCVIQDELASIRNEGTSQSERRFQRAKQEGDFPGTWEPGPLAQYLSALASGLAVQSRGGVSPEALSRIVDQVIANWPEARTAAADRRDK